MVEHECGCGCEHETHDHGHEHGEEGCGGCGGGCGHHHPTSETVSANVGGGVALCRLSLHEGAVVISCNLELENATLTPSCLSRALQGVAFDVERLEGIVGHIKCAASSEAGTARISVTAGNLDPIVWIDGLDDLDEDADINIAVIAYAVKPKDLLEAFLARLERVL